mgnify:CR=1 FL=1
MNLLRLQVDVEKALAVYKEKAPKSGITGLLESFLELIRRQIKVGINTMIVRCQMLKFVFHCPLIAYASLENRTIYFLFLTDYTEA